MMPETRSSAITRNRGFNAALAPERWYVRLLRLAVAAFAGAALVQNTVDSALGRNDTDLVQHFSLFTIQSNFFFVIVLVVGALASRSALPRWWDNVRGAAAFNLVMTGLVYALLVAPPGEMWSWNIGWTGLALHRVAPLFALADWALVTMTRRSGWGRPLAWLAYPVLFLVYTWTRGAIAGWYPYDFLDPLQPGGWGQVLATTAQVLVAFLAVALVMHLVGIARVALATGAATRGARRGSARASTAARSTARGRGSVRDAR